MNEFLQSLTGGYSKIKFLRFTILTFALLNAAAHLYASPSSFPYVTFWLEIEVAAFIVIGLVFLLGLRIWYLPSVFFTVFNLAVYLLSGNISLAKYVERIGEFFSETEYIVVQEIASELGSLKFSLPTYASIILRMLAPFP